VSQLLEPCLLVGLDDLLAGLAEFSSVAPTIVGDREILLVGDGGVVDCSHQ
jgi:hypothetical protein